MTASVPPEVPDQAGARAVANAPWGGTLAVAQALAPIACPWCMAWPVEPCVLHRDRHSATDGWMP